MGKVYSHSHCMVAAAAASDCFGGLFPWDVELPILTAPSESSDSRKFRLALIKPRFESWDELFLKSCLNRRGSALQERELSPRILYFTKHTMLFECREARAGNPHAFWHDHSDTRESLTTRRATAINRKIRRCLDEPFQKGIEVRQFELGLERRYLAWMDMIEGYSERKLSMPSDKFLGVSGLASEFAYLLDNQYVAGLWRRDLCRGLCWRWKQNDIAHIARVKLNVQAMAYRPSWSWAKMTVPVTYDLVYHSPRQVVRAQNDNDKIDWGNPAFMNVSTVPEGKDPNGTFISAVIDLEGLVFRVSRSRTGNFYILGEAVKVIWDFLPQTANAYYVLSLGRTRAGLVLIPTERKEYEYRRAGIISMIQKEWFKDSDLQRLTLV